MSANPASVVPDAVIGRSADAIRQGSTDDLASALLTARADTLALFAQVREQLPELKVPPHPNLNPPLWELGHVGWFQEFWTVRNPQWDRGPLADPHCERPFGVRPDADSLYSSVDVVHGRRWDLDLPGVEDTLDDLTRQFQSCVGLLHQAAPSDQGLYFHRLALLHEDMHHEAGLYMAQALGLEITDPRWQPQALCTQRRRAPGRLSFPGMSWRMGRTPDQGFSFDNELPVRAIALEAYTIDARVVTWGDYLPFVEQGGYRNSDYWDAQGQVWLKAQGLNAPRVLRQTTTGRDWQRHLYGRWQRLEPDQAAVHLSLHEARAWCRWAGRRLPLEAEWEQAACADPGFEWGEVWEWTDTPHAPFPGYVAHPYQDYSAPFFDGRPVLKGGSFMTQPRMKHPQYRNFFEGYRNDIPAGFRSCAL
ncbi:MAG: selenoneine synthase SenA [Burkholderiaceae bacterium]